MSDKELIAMARLAQRDERMSTGALYGDLADRIEALITARDQHWDNLVHWRKQADDLTGQLAAARDDAKEAEAYAEELEAKLAKAVESAFEEGFLVAAADGWVNNHRIEMEWKRSKALAELKGESHD